MRLLKENMFSCPIAEQTGYELKTGLWDDFCFADRDGLSAVRNTYRNAMRYNKDDYIALTELVMILNWKIWQHYNKDKELAKLYNDLWEKTDEYAMNNLKDDELKYFLRTTD